MCSLWMGIVQSLELLICKIFFAYVLDRGMLFHILQIKLSLPIDERGEGAYEGGW